jgi:hypothetical protein
LRSLTSEDLDLVPTADLLQALGRRSLSVVVVQSVLPGKGKGTDREISYYGGWEAALGLLRWGDKVLLEGLSEKR